MRQEIENIIKKNLPEKREISKGVDELGRPKLWQEIVSIAEDRGFNQALSQINPSLIADEVLKVVEKEKERWIFEIKGLMKVSKTEWEALDELLDNLSPNKENKN